MSDGHLMMHLLRAIYWFDEGLQTGLHARGWPNVSRAQSLILVNVAIGVHRQAQLATNLGVSRQAVSQMIREMQDQDFLVIRPDPTDGRAQIVEFSENSAPIRDAALDRLAEMEDRLGSILGHDRLAVLRAALEKDWGPPPAPADAVDAGNVTGPVG